MNKRSDKTSDSRFRVGGQISCYLRGTRWWAEFYAQGRQQRVPLKTRSKKEARIRAARLDGQIIAGTFQPAQPDATVAEIIEAYLEKSVTEDLAASTIKRYKPELERLGQFFASEGVTNIRGVTLALVEKYRAVRKPQVAAATLYHESVLCKQLLNYAHDRNHITTHPLKKLKLKRPRQTPAPTYTLDEVDRIIGENDTYADLFELLAFCGLRIGEARWLTWLDIEIDEDGAGGMLHVRAKPGEWKPKDGDDRVVPLHPRVARMLARRPRRHRFVFTAMPSAAYPKGGHQISDRHALVSLKRILKRLDIMDNTIHGFRHFFVSFCANNGVEPFKLMAWVGHSDLSIVLRYYSLGDADSRRAMSGVPFGPSPDGGSAAEAKQVQIKHNSNARKAG